MDHAGADKGRCIGPWLGGAFLAVVTLAAYLPAFFAGFVYDDIPHILQSPTLTHSWDSLVSIWLRPAWTPQYYPVTHTLWWLEYQLWGFHPAGYHAVNLILHAGAALALWRCLVRLAIDGRVAYLAAVIFALHPVHVESAAYVSELKNVLSAVFYLLAGLSYLRFHDMRPTEVTEDAATPAGAWRWYLLSFGLFLAALLSKTVTASLPAALLLVLWWKNGAIRRRDLLRLGPFVAVGVALGLTTAWLERHQIGVASFPEDFDFSVAERLLIAGRAVWFYAGKLIWPAGLTINYARWDIDATNWRQWLCPLTACAAVAVLWRLRRGAGRGSLAAVLYFCGTLFPALGFVDVYPFRFSFVADHYLYLASIGVLVLIASAWVWMWDRIRNPSGALPLVMALPVVLCFGAMTWRHAEIFQNDATLWEDAARKNPGGWTTQVNLSAIRLAQGDREQARVLAERARMMHPRVSECHNQYVRVLVAQGQLDEAIEYLRGRIEDGLADDAMRVTIVGLLMQKQLFDEALQLARKAAMNARDVNRVRWAEGAVLLAMGRDAEARTHLERAVREAPLRAENHQYLAQAWLASGQVAEAINSLQAAARILPHNAMLQAEVSELLWRQGRLSEAISHLSYAVEAAPGEPSLRLRMDGLLREAGSRRRGPRQLH